MIKIKYNDILYIYNIYYICTYTHTFIITILLLLLILIISIIYFVSLLLLLFVLLLLFLFIIIFIIIIVTNRLQSVSTDMLSTAVTGVKVLKRDVTPRQTERVNRTHHSQ